MRFLEEEKLLPISRFSNLCSFTLSFSFIFFFISLMSAFKISEKYSFHHFFFCLLLYCNITYSVVNIFNNLISVFISVITCHRITCYVYGRQLPNHYIHLSFSPPFFSYLYLHLLFHLPWRLPQVWKKKEEKEALTEGVPQVEWALLEQSSLSPSAAAGAPPPAASLPTTVFVVHQRLHHYP